MKHNLNRSGNNLDNESQGNDFIEVGFSTIENLARLIFDMLLNLRDYCVDCII